MYQHILQKFEFSDSLSNQKNLTFSNLDNLQIDKCINEIDAILNYILQLNMVSTKRIDELSVKFEFLKQSIIEKLSNDPFLCKLLEIIVDGAYEIIFDHIQILNDSIKYESGINTNINSKEKVLELQNQGYCEFMIETNEYFEKVSNELLVFAREEFAGRDDWRGLVWKDFYRHDISNYCNNFLIEKNILEIVSEYSGFESEIAWFGWDYNHSRQKWFKKNNVNPVSQPTNYYHLDSGFDKTKIMFYLTDVDAKDGPFKYVKESNLLDRSLAKFALHLSLDRRANEYLYGADNNIKNIWTDNVELLNKFPNSFIGSTHFGDYLSKESLLTKYLLQNTVQFTRKKGSVVLFNGNLGVHAGGNPIDGERLIIQFGFQNKKRKQGKLEKMIKKFF